MISPKSQRRAQAVGLPMPWGAATPTSSVVQGQLAGPLEMQPFVEATAMIKVCHFSKGPCDACHRPSHKQPLGLHSRRRDGNRKRVWRFF